MRTIKVKNKIRLLAMPAIIAAAAVGFSASAADAATIAKPSSVSATPQLTWVSGGRYASQADCIMSGVIAISNSQGLYIQYRCSPVTNPTGTIAYWQLWLLQM